MNFIQEFIEKQQGKPIEVQNTGNAESPSKSSILTAAK